MMFETGYMMLPMEEGQPSFTALTAAAARAAHLIVDQEPWIFADALAAQLLGERAKSHGFSPTRSLRSSWGSGPKN
jgi:hypothetical protein